MRSPLAFLYLYAILVLEAIHKCKIMDIQRVNPKTKFEILLQRKNAINKKLTEHKSPPMGTADFTLHRLMKEQKEIKQDLAQISFRYTPDTIA